MFNSTLTKIAGIHLREDDGIIESWLSMGGPLDNLAAYYAYENAQYTILYAMRNA